MEKFSFRILHGILILFVSQCTSMTARNTLFPVMLGDMHQIKLENLVQSDFKRKEDFSIKIERSMLMLLFVARGVQEESGKMDTELITYGRELGKHMHIKKISYEQYNFMPVCLLVLIGYCYVSSLSSEIITYE